MAGGKKARQQNAHELEGREQFVRDNAVVLLAERDAKIARLRKVVTRLHSAVSQLRAELQRRPLPPDSTILSKVAPPG